MLWLQIVTSIDLILRWFLRNKNCRTTSKKLSLNVPFQAAHCIVNTTNQVHYEQNSWIQMVNEVMSGAPDYTPDYVHNFDFICMLVVVCQSTK